MVFKSKKTTLETPIHTQAVSNNKVVDFYMPVNMCTTCQYRKEILLEREKIRCAHIPVPPDIKEDIKLHKQIIKEKIPALKDKFIFAHSWDRFVLRFMSKQFKKPFAYLIHNHYYNKDSEYISIFNLFNEIIKKDDRYNFIMNTEKIEKKVKEDLKSIIDSIQTPPQEMTDKMELTQESESFISYSPLSKQDKVIRTLSDEL